MIDVDFDLRRMDAAPIKVIEVVVGLPGPKSPTPPFQRMAAPGGLGMLTGKRPRSFAVGANSFPASYDRLGDAKSAGNQAKSCQIVDYSQEIVRRCAKSGMGPNKWNS